MYIMWPGYLDDIEMGDSITLILILQIRQGSIIFAYIFEKKMLMNDYFYLIHYNSN